MSEAPIRITFLGSGDAFGSGGRLQPCVHIDDDISPFLLDCGGSALIAMKQFGIYPGALDTILVSHLHGDHFSGIPFLLRETQILAARERPLTIAGPKGLEKVIRACMGIFFPSSWSQDLPFDVRFIELDCFQAHTFDTFTATLFPAVHSMGTNPHSIRIETPSKSIAYSGDTMWNQYLVGACRDTDLFICECFAFEGPFKNHLDYSTLRQNRHMLDTRRIVLTHMSAEMLSHLSEVEYDCAHDGMVIIL